MGWYILNNNIINEESREIDYKALDVSVSYPKMLWYLDGEDIVKQSENRNIYPALTNKDFDYPKMLWTINNDDITKQTENKNIYYALSNKDFDYPKMLWYIEEENVYKGTENRNIYPALSNKDFNYPKMLWYIGEYFEELSVNRLLNNDVEKLGAFCHSKNLTSLKIPETIETINNFSFYHSGLKEVNLSYATKYEKFTFPKDCKINYF